MTSASATFEFLSYWHAGTGRGEGAALDAVVVKDSRGYPYLPGRTVKGLLREAVQLLEDFEGVPAGTAADLFGSGPGSHETRYDTTSGLLTVSNATLSGPGFLTDDEAEDHELKAQLLRGFASTKLDEHGLAADHTLRRVEVAIPLRLEATIDGPSDTAWEPVLQQAAPFIRSAGTHRRRGLGRVVVTVSSVAPGKAGA